jgi:hypothetical protein
VRQRIRRRARGVSARAQTALVDALLSFPGALIVLVGDEGLATHAWPDYSGNNRHIFQGTAAARPVLTTVGSRTGARFDGTDDFLQTPSDHGAHGGPSVSSFIVCKLTGATLNSADRFWGNTFGNSDYYGWTFGQVSAGFPDFGIGDTAAVRWTRGPTNLSGTSAAHVLSARAVSGSIVVRDNGIAGPELTDAWTSTISCNSPKYLGAFENDGAINSPTPIDIFCLVDYRPCLSLVQHAELEGYLTDFYEELF